MRGVFLTWALSKHVLVQILVASNRVRTLQVEVEKGFHVQRVGPDRTAATASAAPATLGSETAVGNPSARGTSATPRLGSETAATAPATLGSARRQQQETSTAPATLGPGALRDGGSWCRGRLFFF